MLSSKPEHTVVDQVQFSVVLHESKLLVDMPNKHVRCQDAVKLRVQALVDLVEKILDARQQVGRSSAPLPSQLLHHATVIRHATAPWQRGKGRRRAC